MPNNAFTILSLYIIVLQGSIGIAPTRDCTHFLKIIFIVAGGGFYSYYIHQGNELDKERKVVRKTFYAYKKIYYIFKKYWSNPVWVQFHVYSIADMNLQTVETASNV